MAGATDYSAHAYLEWLVGKTTMPPTTNAYLGLFTAVGTDGNTGFTEVSGNGYARKVTAASDWASASGSQPSQISNANPITFPGATGAGWGNVIAWGMFDAASGGNLKHWDYLGSTDWDEFTCSLASPGIFTAPGHGLTNGDQIVVDAEFGGLLLPTGGSLSGLLTVGGVAGDTFNVGVNTTASGAGMFKKVVPVTVTSGNTISIPGGNLIIYHG